MAIDNTPPRLRLIVTIAIIVVITLVGLDFVLRGYYAYMSDMATREKLAPLRDRDEQHKAEQASFGAAKLPIDQAMAQVAKGTRAEAITPKPSEDMGPMTGWSKMPKQPPLPAPASPLGATGLPGHDTVAHDGHAIAATDGGAALTDGGTATTADAAASKPVPVAPKDAGAKH